MNKSKDSLWNKMFSHIYVEQQIQSHPRTIALLQRYPDAVVIPVTHYKDVFNRSNQNIGLQADQKKLILASNHGQLIFLGAPVCQSFGNYFFYYTSNVMNCIYDCEYCYLQGMYPSSNLVVFVNIEDTFFELERLLLQHPVYLCISYDTDLLALNGLLHFIEPWIEFTRKHSNLTIEIRTKSANVTALEQLPVCNRVIYAWTLSPQSIIDCYEHRTPSLTARLAAISQAIHEGHKVRLCFDPMLSVESAALLYSDMLYQTFQAIPAEQIEDVSVGVFRIAKDYLKRMKRQRPNSIITQYPYIQSQGYCHYDEKTTNALMNAFIQELTHYIEKDRIFIWSNTERRENDI